MSATVGSAQKSNLASDFCFLCPAIFLGYLAYQVPLADLHALLLAFPMRNNKCQMFVADVVVQHGCTLDVTFEVDSLSTIIDMVMERKAYSILTPSAV